MASSASLWDVAAPAPHEVWEDVYRSDPAALPSQSPSWAAAVVATGHYRDVSRLYTFSDGRQAVVPLFETAHGPRRLRRWWSPPNAWGFGGVLARQPFEASDLELVLDDLAAESPLQVRLRPNPLQARLWQQAGDVRWMRLERTAHILSLDGGFAAVWGQRFRPRTRTAVRKAERSGLDIETGNGPMLVEEFHTLFEQSVARWAGKQHEAVALARWRARLRDPVAKFHLLAQASGPALRIWMARLHGEPVAAIIVLQGHNAHYTRGAMDEKLAGPTCANFLLHHLAIMAACEAGCRSYHMGETGRSTSLAQFKSRFGAVATPYAEYLYEQVPLHWIGEQARTLAKRAIGFRDV
jgi:hypothetical protein